MVYEGVARLGEKTKDLVKRLRPGDIAVIDHADVDQVSAEGLLKSGVKVVLNNRAFISGRYPNTGPLVLSSKSVALFECDDDLFAILKEGEHLTVLDDHLVRSSGEKLGLRAMSEAKIRLKMDESRLELHNELEKFVINTLEFVRREKNILIDDTVTPDIRTSLAGRHALVVVRGYNYQQDLRILRSYVGELLPVKIGVDGGADALLAEGFKPDIIIGDMDSVSDAALKCGAELIVHAYPDGRAPGQQRLQDLGLSSILFPAACTSEDLAMLLAYEKGARLIVAVGTHSHLVEFLDKGREGMASTFLVRLKVGDRLVDAKGVSQLYRSSPKTSHLLILVFAALTTLTVVVLRAPVIRLFLSSLVVKLRLVFGL